MDTRFYNCGFGDCFRLDSDSNHLYVDFGIHKNSMTVGNRQKRYDEIIDDIPQNSDFLLTHYHEDHYDGVLYMGDNNNNNKHFRNIYIPDIWSIKESISAVELVLLRGLFTKSILKNDLTLYDFLIRICNINSTINFVQRGDIIQGNYIALWPEPKHLGKTAEKILEKIKLGDELNREVIEVVRKLSVNLRNIIFEMREGIHADNCKSIIDKLNNEKLAYESISNLVISNSDIRQKLSNFSNDISIVFQNINNSNNNSNENVLFTGDISNKRRIWNLMEQNTDNIAEMHKKYKIIKIPHHGTNISRHYHSFTNISDENTIYLIPNGMIKNTRWFICDKYARDSQKTKSTVICVDNKACNAACAGLSNKCNCHEKKLVAVSGTNGLYIDV